MSFTGLKKYEYNWKRSTDDSEAKSAHMKDEKEKPEVKDAKEENKWVMRIKEYRFKVENEGEQMKDDNEKVQM